MVYVYAIVEPDVPLPPDNGLDGAPLRMVHADRVAALVTDLEERAEASEAALWAHEEVVESLMGAGAVLPMRFGSALPNDEAVRVTLEEREAEFAAGLARVRGAVELGLRVIEEPDPEGDDPELMTEAAEGEAGGTGVGTTYLMRRLDRTRRAGALVEQVHPPLEPLARASSHRVIATSPRGVIAAAYLVDAARVDEFRAAVEELDRRLDAAAILCTGPWPPYSFTPGAEAA